MKQLASGSSLLSGIEVKNIVGSTERPVTTVCDDSRNCIADCLFVAVRGVVTDGHLFIDKAISGGASTIVCETIPEARAPHVTYVEVVDSRRVLGILAQRWFNNPSQDIELIAVTGTNGKTTVSYIAYQLLCKLGKNAGLIGTTGNIYGGKKHPTKYTTPEPLLLAELLADMRDQGVEVCVMEVSSHALALHRTAGLSFSAAGFTNISQDHLDFHSSMEEYFLAKCSLSRALAPEAQFIVHDSIAEQVRRNVTSNVLTYGTEQHEQGAIDVKAKELEVHSTKTTFQLQDESGTYSVSTHLVGSFNIDNLVLACALVNSLGIAMADICENVQYVEAPAGRLQCISEQYKPTVFVDFAHTPDALRRVLTVLREQMHAPSKLYCVFGCGGDRDTTKRPIMGAVAEELADIVVVTSDNPRTEKQRDIEGHILAGMKSPHQAIGIEDRAKAIAFAIQNASEEDVIVIAGKGHEEYQILGTEKVHFSDQEQVRHYFSLLHS